MAVNTIVDVTSVFVYNKRKGLVYWYTWMNYIVHIISGHDVSYNIIYAHYCKYRHCFFVCFYVIVFFVIVGNAGRGNQHYTLISTFNTQYSYTIGIYRCYMSLEHARVVYFCSKSGNPRRWAIDNGLVPHSHNKKRVREAVAPIICIITSITLI